MQWQLLFNSGHNQVTNINSAKHRIYAFKQKEVTKDRKINLLHIMRNEFDFQFICSM